MDAKRVGQQIAERRREKGLSQSELAAQLHVTDKAVGRWEQGRGLPAVDSLLPLAQALDMTVDELLRGAAAPAAQSPAPAARDGGAPARLPLGWGLPWYPLCALLAVGLAALLAWGWGGLLDALLESPLGASVVWPAIEWVDGLDGSARSVYDFGVSLNLRQLRPGLLAGLLGGAVLELLRARKAALIAAGALLPLWLLAPGGDALAQAALGASCALLLTRLPELVFRLAERLRRRRADSVPDGAPARPRSRYRVHPLFYVLAELAAALSLFLAAALRMALNGGSFTVQADLMCWGALAALLPGCLLYLAKRPGLPPAFAGLVLAAYLALPGAWAASQWLQGGLVMACLTALPDGAALLARLPRPGRRAEQRA